MDRIGPNGTRIVPAGPPPRPPEPLPAEPSRHGRNGGFALEAATIKLEANLSIVRLLQAGGSPTPAAGVSPTVPGDTAPNQVLARVRDFVRDVFQRNGIEYQDLTQDEAQAKIGPGGDLSPEAVSKRILDFVSAFADGTSGREQVLRDAVERGFKEAAQAFGRELPDISHRTMDLVRAGLDRLFAKPAPAPSPAPVPPATPSIDRRA